MLFNCPDVCISLFVIVINCLLLITYKLILYDYIEKFIFISSFCSKIKSKYIFSSELECGYNNFMEGIFFSKLI